MTKELKKVLSRFLVDGSIYRPKNWADLVKEASSLGLHLNSERIRGEDRWYFLESGDKAMAVAIVSGEVSFKEQPK